VAGRHWILPAIGDVPVERLNGAHVAEVFARMERISAAITARRGTSRSYVHVEHRVYAALREFCNYELRRTHRLSFNPVYAVELAPEVTPEARRWSAAQARAFLAATAGDPLGLLFRIVLLRGARRGEAVGLRWADSDLDAGYVRVRRPIVLIGGDVVESAPKTPTGDRLIWLDARTVRLLREHRKAQLGARLRAGEAWHDNDLMFCKDDGTPYRPDYVTRRFKALAAQAGLPVIKLHEGRHSAASLARDAEVDRRSGGGRSATPTRP
jgi:integrase